MPKWILYALAAVALTIVTVGFAIPSRWSVEQSIEITASPDTVRPLIEDPKRWPDWTEWNKKNDESLEWNYSGPARGAGAVMEWNGKTMGRGRIEFTEADANGVRFQVYFRGHEPTRGSITFAATEGATRVAWKMEGDAGSNPFVHLFLPSMKGALANQLDEDLHRLADVAPKLK